MGTELLQKPQIEVKQRFSLVFEVKNSISCFYIDNLFLPFDWKVLLVQR